MVNALHTLNKSERGPSLPEFMDHMIQIIVEFGVADEITFEYIDREVLNRCLEAIEKEEVRVLDFLCIVRYYNLRGGKRLPLRFDYYIVRFVFEDREMQILVYHERGTRRLAIEDLLEFVVQAVNVELERMEMKPLIQSYIRSA
ncbi:MAG: hypothetical protein RMJ07_04965 [Nitrososphaerota archaeon]|nr:hypothetical protein [Candidatus Bathyarchaeota archaeon]MDW8049016.1 hypothetical protein [Nitrososphaerota archaeon]